MCRVPGFCKELRDHRTPCLRALTVLYSLHPLLEDGVPPGLTDDQVGPLHHHDTDEEGRVASELHDFPLFVGLKHRGQADEPGAWPARPGAERPPSSGA